MTVKIAFIGAGSTIFMKNIIGDALHFPSLADAQIALMDIDKGRLEESAAVARKMIATMKAGATVSTTMRQRAALEGDLHRHLKQSLVLLHRTHGQARDKVFLHQKKHGHWRHRSQQ